MAHIMVGALEEVKLVRSAGDPELETLGLWILKLSLQLRWLCWGIVWRILAFVKIGLWILREAAWMLLILPRRHIWRILTGYGSLSRILPATNYVSVTLMIVLP
jgi:hypothetical protein